MDRNERPTTRGASCRIQVRLAGGLGNQLFGYYAGYSLAKRLGVGLTCDLRVTREGMTDHGTEILKFGLDAAWLRRSALRRWLAPNGSRRHAYWARAEAYFERRSCVDQVFRADGWGYEPALLSQAPGTILDGYFQSWRHVIQAVEVGAPLQPQLRRESAWLRECRAEISARDVVAVHVRRGDYAQLPGFGFLDPAYYARALNAIGASPSKHVLWLFSDAPDAAAACVPEGYRFRLVNSPQGAAETLVAMSLAKRLIVANSTFGWWGAWFAGSEACVVAPDPWFKAERPIADLLPPGWMRLSSSWM